MLEITQSEWISTLQEFIGQKEYERREMEKGDYGVIVQIHIGGRWYNHKVPDHDKAKYQHVIAHVIDDREASIWRALRNANNKEETDG